MELQHSATTTASAAAHVLQHSSRAAEEAYIERNVIQILSSVPYQTAVWWADLNSFDKGSIVKIGIFNVAKRDDFKDE